MSYYTRGFLIAAFLGGIGVSSIADASWFRNRTQQQDPQYRNQQYQQQPKQKRSFFNRIRGKKSTQPTTRGPLNISKPKNVVHRSGIMALCNDSTIIASLEGNRQAYAVFMSKCQAAIKEAREARLKAQEALKESDEAVTALTGEDASTQSQSQNRWGAKPTTQRGNIQLGGYGRTRALAPPTYNAPPPPVDPNFRPSPPPRGSFSNMEAPNFPPPPGFNNRAPAKQQTALPQQGGRGDLLRQIQAGKTLKKTKTNAGRGQGQAYGDSSLAGTLAKGLANRRGAMRVDEDDYEYEDESEDPDDWD